MNPVLRPHHCQAIIEEQFIQSKTGRLKDSEDSLSINGNFVVVIDGATSHASRKWNHKTGGKVAATLITRAFDEMPFDSTARQAASLITSMINDFYAGFNQVATVQKDPSQRIAASFAALSLYRQEVWLIGDCQFLLGNELVTNKRKVDQILSGVRALCLEMELLNGMTIEELQHDERGRKFIAPLLKRLSLFQNNPAAGDYWYSAVDGFSIPDAGIITRAIPENVDTVVLASDGYPFLKDTLKESESILQDILCKDPLMFREYKSTKGKVKGQVSFNDRAFIKVKIKR